MLWCLLSDQVPNTLQFQVFSGFSECLRAIFSNIANIASICLRSSKVRVFFEKQIGKKHFCRTDKNYYYLCKSNIPVINLIVGCRNIIEVSKMWVCKNLRKLQ